MYRANKENEIVEREFEFFGSNLVTPIKTKNRCYVVKTNDVISIFLFLKKFFKFF